MGNPVAHFEIWAKSTKKQKTFYQKLLGWKIDDKNPMGYGMIDTGTRGGISGGLTNPMNGKKAGVTFYVSVKNIGKTLELAKKLGGKIVIPETEIPGAGISIAMFKDPEGNPIGIMK